MSRVRMLSDDGQWTLDGVPDPAAVGFVTSDGDQQGAIIDESRGVFYNFGGGSEFARSAAERLLLRALQEYGAFVCDSTAPGLMAFYALNTRSPGAVNYPPEWLLGIRNHRVKQLLAELVALETPEKLLQHDSAKSMGQPVKRYCGVS